MTLGEKIKDFGIKKFGGVTKFSEALDVKLQSLYAYFNNSSKPGSDFLMKLKDMGCDLNWLLSEDDINVILKKPSIEFMIKNHKVENKNLKEENKKLRMLINQIEEIAKTANNKKINRSKY